MKPKDKDLTSSYTLRYHHIKELPLSVFVEILCENNLSLLGDAPLDQLIKNWQVLSEQYNEAIGGASGIAKMQKVIKILLLKSKINRGGILLNSLAMLPTEYAFKECYTFGYMLPNMAFIPENIQRLAKVFNGYLKRDLFELKMMSEGVKEKEEYKKPVRTDFIDTIITLQDHFKLNIDFDRVTTEMYCAYVTRYNNDMEKLIQLQDKQSR